MGADVTGLQQLASHKPLPDPGWRAGPDRIQTPGTELAGQAFTVLNHQAPVKALKDAIASSWGQAMPD